MATTTNFGWDTPDDTDLVKDGAAAIRTALNGVDTSFVDLKGGTTGQVLAKASATDLDFVWSADAAGMTNPMTTTGDTIYSSSGSTPARLGIGTTGQILTVAGGVPSWSTFAGGGKVLQVVQASTTTEKFISSTSYVDTNLTGTITPTSATSKILVMIVQSGQIFRAISGLNAAIQLLRGASVVWAPTGTTAQMQYEGTGTTNFSLCTYMPLTYLDSPATTSATTYKTQGKVSTAANSAVFTVQTGSNPSQMILMEIGA
jgi:hypothetical protein